MSTSVAGILCLLAFSVSQGLRDALFGNVFQSVSFLLVAVLAFSTATAVFAFVGILRRPGDLRRMATMPGRLAALNLSTGLAWLSFFFGLTYLEPAVVATLYNGVGPLTALALRGTALGGPPVATLIVERWLYVALSLTLAALVVVVLSDRSGLAVTDLAIQSVAIVGVVTGGATIAISHMIARTMTDAGLGSDTVMGWRFLLILGAAGTGEWWAMGHAGEYAAWPAMADMAILAFTAFTLIIFPSFLLQLGVARATPLTVNVMRSLGPVFVFAVQQADGRLQFSGATLLCVLTYCVIVVAASVLRTRYEGR